MIPTRNRADEVCGAVDSLLAQTFAPREILVVDNGSSDATLPLLRRRYGPKLRLLRERRRGVSYARNLAVGHARGEIIAFLDDDARAARDWIERMLACFEETGAIGVGGPAVPVWETPPPSYILASKKARDYIGAFTLSSERIRLRGFFDYLIGTNCAFRRKVFEEGARFLVIPRGRPTGGGDLEFSRRIAAHRPVYYDPRVRVYHNIPARKFGLSFLAQTAFDAGLKKVAIGRRISPRGWSDLWGVDGFMSLFSISGYAYGQCLRLNGRLRARRRDAESD